MPVVRGYVRAAAGNAVPAVIFVAGYLAVWSAVGIPAFLASNRLDPMVHACPWVGRFAGAVAVVAGLHQLTPLKATCLRQCRWPISLSRGPDERPDGAARALVAGGR